MHTGLSLDALFGMMGTGPRLPDDAYRFAKGEMGSVTDTEFDPSRATLYYARVIEIPTPRWTTYDAVCNNLELLSDVPTAIQERAWSSPIWFVHS